MAVEEGFQIHVSDDEAGRLESAGDVHNLVSAKQANEQSGVWEALCVVIESAGIPREKITAKTRLRDLGIT